MKEKWPPLTRKLTLHKTSTKPSSSQKLEAPKEALLDKNQSKSKA